MCCTLLRPKPLNPSGKQHSLLCNTQHGRERKDRETRITDIVYWCLYRVEGLSDTLKHPHYDGGNRYHVRVMMCQLASEKIHFSIKEQFKFD